MVVEETTRVTTRVLDFLKVLNGKVLNGVSSP